MNEIFDKIENLIKLNNYIEACDFIDKNLTDNNTEIYIDLLFYKAFLLFKLGKPDEAIDNFIIILQNTKYLKNKLSLCAIAICYFNVGYFAPEDFIRFASVLKDYSEPDDELVIRLYMHLYLEGLCHPNELLNIIENPKIKNNSLSFYLLKADVYDLIGEKDKAINCFQAAIPLDKEREDYYLHRIGFIHYEVEQYNDALICFSKEIELLKSIYDNKYEPARLLLSATYFYRGNTYDKLKNYENALKDFEKAYELDPNYPNIKEEIEEIKQKLNSNK